MVRVVHPSGMSLMPRSRPGAATGGALGGAVGGVDFVAIAFGVVVVTVGTKVVVDVVGMEVAGVEVLIVVVVPANDSGVSVVVDPRVAPAVVVFVDRNETAFRLRVKVPAAEDDATMPAIAAPTTAARASVVAHGW